MLFTHHSDPDPDESRRVDGDDYTYELTQSAIPGVAELAGLDPAEDMRRENLTLRTALLEARADLAEARGILSSMLAYIDAALETL